MKARIYRQTVWQWVGLVVAVGCGGMMMVLAYRMGRGRAVHFHRLSLLRYWLTLAFPIAAMLVPLAVKNFVGNQLAISGTTLAVVDFCANLAFLFAVMVVLVSAGSRVAAAIIASPRIHPKGIEFALPSTATYVELSHEEGTPAGLGGVRRS
jgi:hypothetical protein